jgi:hypothetical protein
VHRRCISGYGSPAAQVYLVQEVDRWPPFEELRFPSKAEALKPRDIVFNDDGRASTSFSLHTPAARRRG